MSGEKKGFFSRLKEGLTKTRNNIVHGIDSVFNLPTLLSSNAASISSSKQKGDGFKFWMANKRAIAVNALRNEDMTDLSAMKRDAAALKDQIRKLGDVNVNAIEDYKNLMERYGFLKSQHDDLVEAEKTLLHIIDELDTAMRKQFQEKFAEISKESDLVFQSSRIPFHSG